jgi:hypothetical protein
MTSSFLPNFKLLLLVLTGVVLSVSGFGQQCERLTHPKCKLSAGYNFTAPFSDIDGKPYQEVKGKELNIHLPLLNSCSKYSATILCSLYFPKCIPSISRPLLPCRSVCNGFVQNCSNELNTVAMYGMLTAMCDLLPEYDNKTQNCFLPEGFNKNHAASGM